MNARARPASASAPVAWPAAVLIGGQDDPIRNDFQRGDFRSRRMAVIHLAGIVSWRQDQTRFVRAIELTGRHTEASEVHDTIARQFPITLSRLISRSVAAAPRWISLGLAFTSLPTAHSSSAVSGSGTLRLDMCDVGQLTTRLALGWALRAPRSERLSPINEPHRRVSGALLG